MSFLFDCAIGGSNNGDSNNKWQYLRDVWKIHQIKDENNNRLKRIHVVRRRMKKMRDTFDANAKYVLQVILHATAKFTKKKQKKMLRTHVRYMHINSWLTECDCVVLLVAVIIIWTVHQPRYNVRSLLSLRMSIDCSDVRPTNRRLFNLVIDYFFFPMWFAYYIFRFNFRRLWITISLRVLKMRRRAQWLTWRKKYIEKFEFINSIAERTIVYLNISAMKIKREKNNLIWWRARIGGAKIVIIASDDTYGFGYEFHLWMLDAESLMLSQRNFLSTQLIFITRYFQRYGLDNQWTIMLWSFFFSAYAINATLNVFFKVNL